jgi:hypothetical protein
MMGLEPDAAMRLVFGWGEKTARVEILGRAQDPYGHIVSPDITALQRPGIGLGPVGWVIRVANLDQALARIQTVGGQVVAGPLGVDNDLHGKGLIATVQTPEKTWLSVWEHR